MHGSDADPDDPTAVLLTVNGSTERLSTDGSAAATLLDGLRNQLGLRGVRTGCTIGACGSCTVIVDGRPDKSCQIPLGTVTGADVITPEGLGDPDVLHAVQRAFIETGAAQCGFCINGMIMTVAALARRGDVPDEPTLRAALDEHICRCGTHARILRASRSVLGMAAPAEDGHEFREVDIAEPDAWDASLDGAIGQAVEERLVPLEDGRIEIRVGKVEIGQGIGQAMLRIVASGVGIDEDLLVLAPVSTDGSPDEGFTSGSFSVDTSGVTLATAARAFRRILFERAGRELGAAPTALDLTVGEDGVAYVGDGRQRVSLARLAESGPITGTTTVEDRPDWNVPRGATVGRPRHDLTGKLTGAEGYVHDMTLPGMLHARAVLPPTYGATVLEVDVESVRSLPGVVSVLVADRVLVVVAETERDASRARSRLIRAVRWDDPGLEVGPGDGDAPEAFRALPSRSFVRAAPEADLVAAAHHTATFRQPYQAHAQISPSCAVAHHHGHDDVTEVWQHGQGVYPLRAELAALFGVSVDHFIVHHRAGPGAYGQTLADDAAAFAAFAARELPDRPVRFQFTVDEEFSWEPYGSAVLVDLAAALDEDGRLASWSHRTLTDVHSTRARGSGHGLMISWLRGGERDPWPGPHEGGVRNALPLYEIPALEVTGAYVEGPLRTSALRTLGSFHNVFAAESFMDEMAERARRDPVEFRMAHLQHRPRVRRVLETAAQEIGWEHRVGPSGRGIGIAVSQYKDVKGIVAQAVEVDVDVDLGTIRVIRIITVCDAGEVVDPDGLVNQIEGGTLQGLSRTIAERVLYSSRGIRSKDWLDYPVLGFASAPDLRTIVLQARGTRPLGVGEASMPPVSAAVANAIDDAIGVRVRDLPITTEALQQQLLQLEGAELDRVLIG